MKSILGISAFYHDSAACILKDGKIIAAAQEERFTRIKHDASYPKNESIKVQCTHRRVHANFTQRIVVHGFDVLFVLLLLLPEPSKDF